MAPPVKEAFSKGMATLSEAGTQARPPFQVAITGVEACLAPPQVVDGRGDSLTDERRKAHAGGRSNAWQSRAYAGGGANNMRGGRQRV